MSDVQVKEGYVEVDHPAAMDPSASEDDHTKRVVPIDVLEGNGISKTDISKLKAAYFFTAVGVAHATVRQLTAVRGISEAKALKLQEEAYKHCEMGFTTAAAIYNSEESLIHITTGSKNLDSMLEGGIETGSLTEIYGEFRTGKSQLCHQLAVNAQLNMDNGGGEGRVVYIDCEGTFKSSRIRSMAEHLGLEYAHAMNNIAHGRAYNHEQLSKLIDQSRELMSRGRFVLLIIDSIMALLRADFCGRGELSERQQRLNQILRKCRMLADEFGVGVVYTNQVQSSVDGMGMGFDAKKPIGGNIIAHASTTRLQLKKYKGPLRTCKVVDSPCLAEADCHFGIYSEGIDDPRDEVESMDDN